MLSVGRVAAEPAASPGRQLYLRVVALCLGSILLPVQPAAVAQASPGSEAVQIAGVVTDAAGRVLADLEVVLEAAHRGFDIRKLTRVRRGLTRRSTRTDDSGRFALSWYRNDYFNDFELRIGMTVRVPDGDQFYTLERLPLPGLSTAGDSLAVEVVIADTAFLARYRNFVAGLDSEDERGVYAQMGIPGKIDRLRLATHEETTWWYFEAGRVYRFKEGALIDIDTFEPVAPFGDDSETRQ